jgi:protein phosphatase PTC7
MSPKIFRSFNTNYYLDSSGCSVGKLFYLNEDAFFNNEYALGVADGIGSLKSEFGISSRDFSHELMVKCDQFSRIRAESLSKKLLTCKEIIKQAYNSLESGGSSTFLLAVLSGRQINILNLGDCGLILLRFDCSFKVVFQTTAKVHAFNTPYQLTRKFSLKQLTEGKTSVRNIDKSDDINDADEFVITTLPGDFVVMGSDGLWDNLYPNEIVKIFEQYRMEPVHKIATIITKIAKIRAIGISKTPFSNSLRVAYGKNNYVGGKIDDITVVVAKVLVR